MAGKFKWKLQCEHCDAKFEWPHANPPDECPICGAYVGDEGKDPIAIPFISSAKNRSADSVYKAMERSTEHHANVAAEMAGVPASEMSAMKLTNMQDNLREGDISVREVVNPVSQQMDAMKARGLPVGFGSNGAALSPDVQSGPFPNAGAKMIDVVRGRHQANIDPRHAGATSSSLPALETLNPGYRRRG